MIRLFDANAFMEASRLYYGFDIAPGFWSWLDGHSAAGTIASVPAVRAEILRGNDDLMTWARTLPSGFWIAESPATIGAMRELASWANHPDRFFTQAAIAEFLESADFRLVAEAMASGGTVITRETPSPQSRRKVKIPDACDAFDVPWADPFSAYRALGMALT